MELRVLRYFLAVVEERNISRAAEKLHVSQPTISRQIKELEEEVGITLLNRDNRTITLTAPGEYFANQARQIMKLADKTIANVQQTAAISGNIMIGSAEVPMMRTIADTIKALHHKWPHVQANIYSTDVNEVHEQLNNGVFDFGVVMEPSDKHDYNFINLPGTTRWGIMSRVDQPLAKHSVIIAEDLVNQSLITSQGAHESDILNNWMGNNASTAHIIATYNLLYNASIMVSAGVGSALCLEGIVNTTDTDLTFVPLEPVLQAHSSLIWSKHMPLSAAANAFLSLLQTQIAV